MEVNGVWTFMVLRCVMCLVILDSSGAFDLFEFCIFLFYSHLTSELSCIGLWICIEAELSA